VGRIVAVGEGVDPARIGERVVVAPYIADEGDAEGFETAGFLGADFDGAFAQFARVPARSAIPVPDTVPISDAALATLPCSGGTAMNMLVLAKAKAGDLAVVTGASGGVGAFLVQILKALGAEVVAVAGAAKAGAVRALGADHVVDRAAPDLAGAVLAATGGRRPTIAADVVGGAMFPALIGLLARRGRYVTAGAIAGPMVTLDLRSLYLKSLVFHGSTVYLPGTFPRLLDLVRAGRIAPPVAATRPLSEIREAQAAFLGKTHVGSMVLIPPPVGRA
jgi:NADPH:quinone reductase-like Zn-dependent oxidoreductase